MTTKRSGRGLALRLNGCKEPLFTLISMSFDLLKGLAVHDIKFECTATIERPFGQPRSFKYTD